MEELGIELTHAEIAALHANYEASSYDGGRSHMPGSEAGPNRGWRGRSAEAALARSLLELSIVGV